jgi:hypothetical protein
MANEGIYISLTSDEQRKNRSEILMIQSDVITLIKKISELEDLRKEKREVSSKLAQEYISLIKKLKTLDSEMPSPQMPKPKNVEKTIPKVEVEPKIKKPKNEKSKHHDLEEELLEIQRQLKMLTED